MGTGTSISISATESPRMVGPHQPDRCRHHLMRVPSTFTEFEAELKQWIASCVASRTKGASGLPVRREQKLVEGNPSVKDLWSKLGPYHGTGEFVRIEALYSWVKTQDSWVAASIRFSSKAPAMRIAGELARQQRSFAISRERHSLEQRCASLERQVRELTTTREQLRAELERIREYAYGIKNPTVANYVVDGVNIVHDLVFAPEAMDMKVDHMSKARVNSEVKSDIRKYNRKIREIQDRIDKLEAEAGRIRVQIMELDYGGSLPSWAR